MKQIIYFWCHITAEVKELPADKTPSGNPLTDIEDDGEEKPPEEESKYIWFSDFKCENIKALVFPEKEAPKKGPLYQVRCVAAYKATDHDELTMKVDDIINVLAWPNEDNAVSFLL